MKGSIVGAVLLLAVVAAARTAEAVTANCLPSPFPGGPPAGVPSYVLGTAPNVTLTVWRQTCQDTAPEFVILMRVAEIQHSPVLL